ncbi:MAG: hypothetical protein ACJA2F_001107, partial [Nitriliruptoraceae bacterium]
MSAFQRWWNVALPGPCARKLVIPVAASSLAKA